MEVSVLKGVLSSFNETGSLFALSTGDGRVKVFNVSSGQLKCQFDGGAAPADGAAMDDDKGHLDVQYTCMTWAVAASQAKRKVADKSLALILGMASGEVAAWDTQVDEISWREVASQTGAVTALVSSARSASVFSGDGGGDVCEWAAATGQRLRSFSAGKHAISGLALSRVGGAGAGGSDGLLVAGTGIALYDLASEKRVCKFTGHTLPVVGLACAPGAPFAVSVAEGERQAAVWDTAAAQAEAAEDADAEGQAAKPGASGKKAGAKVKSKKKKAEAAAVLSLTDAAVAVAVGPAVTGGGFTVTALSERGEAFVWRCDENGVAERADAPCTIRVQHKKKKSKAGQALESLMAVRVLPSAGPSATKGADASSSPASSAAVMVVRGSFAAPVFEAVAVPEVGEGGASPAVELEPADKGLLLRHVKDAEGEDGSAPASGKSVRVAVHGPENAMDAELPFATAAIEGEDGGKKKKKKKKKDSAADDNKESNAAEDQGGNKRKAGAEDEEDHRGPGGGLERGGVEGDEVPLEEQLERESELPSLGDVLSSLGIDTEPPDVEDEAGRVAEAPRADSLQVLLTQAVRSGDNALLERCLNVVDEKVIANTVKKLRPSDAALFLKSVVDKFSSRSGRGADLSRWLRAVLLHHASFLMQAPDMQRTLTALYQVIDARLAVHQPMLALQGRLDLLAAQVS
eukprot:jgi/Mesvir1/5944/Mv00707-RA.2